MDWLANMNWWALLICGALIGWLAEWLIDYFYWRKEVGARDRKIETVNKEVVTLQGANTQLNADYKRVQTDYDGVNTRLVARNHEYDDLSLRHETTESELTTANGMLGDYRTRVDTLDTELGEVKTRSDGYETELKDLRVKYIERSKEVDTKETELVGLRGKYGEMETSLTGMHAQLGDKDAEVSRLSGLLGGKDAEIEGVNSELASQVALVNEQNERVGEIQGRLNGLEDENLNLRRTVGDRNTTIDELRANVDSRDGELGEVRNKLGIGAGVGIVGALGAAMAASADTGEKDQLTARVGELETEVETLAGEKAALAADLESSNEWLGVYGEATEELQAEAAASESAEVAEMENWVGVYGEATEELQAKVDDCGAKLAAAEAAAAEAAAVEPVEDLQPKVDELQFRVNTLDVENAALRRSLLSAEANKAAAEATVVTNFVPTEADNSGEVDKLKGLLSDKDGEVDDLNVQLADAIEVSRERGSNIDRLSDENADLRARLAALEAAQKSADDNVGVVAAGAGAGALGLAAATSDDDGELTGDDFTVIYGIGPVYQNRLYEAGITTYADLCGADPEIVEIACDPGVTPAVAARWIEDACTVNSGGTPPDRAAEAAAMTGDDYTVIYGIGPVFQSRLYASGLLTYADLCGSTPEVVEAACDPGVTPETAALWIADACTLASGGTPADRSPQKEESAPPPPADQRDNLTKVKGIGKVFQGKLYDGGIYTWEQLSTTDEAAITDIISPKDWQKIEPDSWKSQAAVLARKKRQRGGIMPDDLKQINGIGPVYEGKLKEAGIDTFAALSKTAPKRISDIIDPEGFQEIDPSSWIAEAAEFATKKS